MTQPFRLSLELCSTAQCTTRGTSAPISPLSHTKFQHAMRPSSTSRHIRLFLRALLARRSLSLHRDLPIAMSQQHFRFHLLSHCHLAPLRYHSGGSIGTSTENISSRLQSRRVGLSGEIFEANGGLVGVHAVPRFPPNWP